MILNIIQIFFPWYYKRVWNTEFREQMEKIRAELHAEFPEFPDVVNRRVDEAYGRWLK